MWRICQIFCSLCASLKWHGESPPWCQSSQSRMAFVQITKYRLGIQGLLADYLLLHCVLVPAYCQLVIEKKPYQTFFT